MKKYTRNECKRWRYELKARQKLSQVENIERELQSKLKETAENEEVKTTLETSGEDVKLHSKRVWFSCSIGGFA
jgi:hypothetical protein